MSYKSKSEILEKVKLLPSCPGIYMMKDKFDNIIYIGKSKVLKNRLPYYFQPEERLDIKTRKLSEHINDFDWICTGSESEALILENELIKKHSPKYNIKLKDAKNYPYVKIDYSSPFPNLRMSRTRKSDNAKYFGPYTSANIAHDIIKTIEKNFHIASCGKKFIYGKEICRPCLNSHMKQCCAPCSGKISPEEYTDIFSEIELFLKGDYETILASLDQKMQNSANELRFEAAARFRDRAYALRKLAQKQKIISDPEKDQDLFGLYEGNTLSAIAVIFVRNGVVADKEEILFSADELSNHYALYDLLERYYTKLPRIPKQILTSFDLGEESEAELSSVFSEKTGYKVTVHHPQRGEKKSLVDMAVKNAEEIAKHRSAAFAKDKEILFNLTNLLHLECYPSRIEAYDISNHGENDIYAGMIVLSDGKFKKSDYRSFTIKSVLETQDDYASMKEALSRRIEYLINPEKSEKENCSLSKLPDLILLDGGKGHVFVIKSLFLEKNISIPVFGMIKDKYHKTRTLTDGEKEISIAKDQSLFSFFYRIQEEVHRFTFSKMDNSRRKRIKSSVLENINGIGEKKAKQLLSHFKSITAIKKATQEELCNVKGINPKIALNIIEYFKTE